MVDDMYYDYLMQYTWHVDYADYDGRYYAQRCYDDLGNRVSQRMHRVILCLTDPNMIVDHIDGNGLNNKISNLRIANAVQNAQNRKKANIDDATSIYKGVYFANKKWVATIAANHKRYYLGRFKTETQAAAAYNTAAKLLHGEFAYLNNI